MGRQKHRRLRGAAGIVITQCIESAIAFVVVLIPRLSALFNPVDWFSVAIPLPFTLGFGYFQFVKSSAS